MSNTIPISFSLFPCVIYTYLPKAQFTSTCFSILCDIYISLQNETVGGKPELIQFRSLFCYSQYIPAVSSYVVFICFFHNYTTAMKTVMYWVCYKKKKKYVWILYHFRVAAFGVEVNSLWDVVFLLLIFFKVAMCRGLLGGVWCYFFCWDNDLGADGCHLLNLNPEANCKCWLGEVFQFRLAWLKQ